METVCQTKFKLKAMKKTKNNNNYKFVFLNSKDLKI